MSLEDALADGPAVVVHNCGSRCSFCAGQLQTFDALAYDLWRHLDVDVLPILGDPVPDLVEMRDRFDLGVQLLSEAELSVLAEYTDVEEHPRFGELPVAGTLMIDAEVTARYAQIAEDSADRTYANYLQAFVRDGFERPYADD